MKENEWMNDWKASLSCASIGALGNHFSHLKNEIESICWVCRHSGKRPSPSRSRQPRGWGTCVTFFAECRQKETRPKIYRPSAFFLPGVFFTCSRQWTSVAEFMPLPSTVAGKDHLCRTPTNWNSEKTRTLSQTWILQWCVTFSLNLLVNCSYHRQSRPNRTCTPQSNTNLTEPVVWQHLFWLLTILGLTRQANRLGLLRFRFLTRHRKQLVMVISFPA